MDAQGLIWLGLALAAGVVEIFSLSLVFLMVAGGAAVAAVVAALTGDPIWSVLAFSGTTGLLLVAVRPALTRYSGRDVPGTLTGTAALIDRQAVVLAEVTSAGGLVKLSGETWSARTAGSSDPLEVGSSVRVIAIEGATVLVAPAVPRTALPGGANPSDGPEPAA